MMTVWQKRLVPHKNIFYLLSRCSYSPSDEKKKTREKELDIVGDTRVNVHDLSRTYCKLVYKTCK